MLALINVTNPARRFIAHWQITPKRRPTQTCWLLSFIRCDADRLVYLLFIVFAARNFHSALWLELDRVGPFSSFASKIESLLLFSLLRALFIFRSTTLAADGKSTEPPPPPSRFVQIICKFHPVFIIKLMMSIKIFWYLFGSREMCGMHCVAIVSSFHRFVASERNATHTLFLAPNGLKCGKTKTKAQLLLPAMFRRQNFNFDWLSLIPSLISNVLFTTWYFSNGSNIFCAYKIINLQLKLCAFYARSVAAVITRFLSGNFLFVIRMFEWKWRGRIRV